ncbi:acyl-CoA thioesterase [Polynucleobacter alcilacus]|jgi:acyl-CoA thioester hydrolase|uniref:acyl-CoA thioesterase n=1 Tax=Polynucleobacter alcilacus TaxID=1819739 RepID=UPI001C0BCE46|nr:thioesterase family protein [Polynucleobacter alcilacus]MBU3566948.1 acyl-CoA thioesterase [Polynucleobacter alcilacus]
MRITIPEERKLVHEVIMPIRWGDMDAYGHVNNTVYFRYMEQARVDWIHSLGYQVAPEGESVIMINAFCNFFVQLTYPGDLIIKTFVGTIGRTSMDVFHTMTLTSAPDILAADGGTTLVWVDINTSQSVPWPEDILQKVRA